MKKISILCLAAVLVLTGFFFVGISSAADIKEATITAKVDLPALMSRKNYRLGVRAGLLSPTDSVNVSKDSTFTIGLDFDAKLNENLDSGPRFTYVSKKFNDGGTTNATYGVLMFGYGARVYLTYFGDYGSTHGFFNAYLAGEINYAAASKSSEILANSPSGYAGFIANGGVGLELAFGPNTTGFVDIRYQKASIKDSGGSSLPLDGIMINFGTRLAFI